MIEPVESGQLARLVSPAWDEPRARRVQRALADGLRRRARRRTAGAVLAGVALVSAALLGLLRARQAQTPMVAQPRISSSSPVVVAPWRQLAERGEWARAWELLASQPPARDPDDLLLVADVARLSRHPEGAVDPLTRLLRAEPRGARAQAAAFTLGRVLDELRRPAQAAAAFAHARAADPAGPLAGDALAREADAWSDAGDELRAARRAAEYLMLHPDGNRLGAMRRHAGEPPRPSPDGARKSEPGR